MFSIDRSLVDEIVEINESNALSFSKLETNYGEFFIEGLLATFSMPETDFAEAVKSLNILHNANVLKKSYDKAVLDDAQKKFNYFLQVHNHELFHFYQVLSLPALAHYMSIRKSFIQFEAVIMLKHIENGGHFNLLSHRDFQDAVVNNEYKNADELQNLNNINRLYLYYTDDYIHRENGISIRDILESMAHVMSLLQFSQEYREDYLEIGEADVYRMPFDYFISKISANKIDKYWEYLIFVYICFFSLQAVSDAKQENQYLPLNNFFVMCESADFFVNELIKFKEYFDESDITSLREKNHYKLDADILSFISDKQLSSLYAFFCCVDVMNQFHQKMSGSGTSKGYQYDEITYVKEIAKKFGLGESIYELGLMAVYPYKFFQIRLTYDKYGKSRKKKVKYTCNDESRFYFLISSCNSLLSRNKPTWCCNEHGYVNDKVAVLFCKKDDGTAEFIRKLTRRKPDEVFIHDK
jgi:hypothetical protein